MLRKKSYARIDLYLTPTRERSSKQMLTELLNSSRDSTAKPFEPCGPEKEVEIEAARDVDGQEGD